MKKPTYFARIPLQTLSVIIFCFCCLASCKKEELPITIRGKVVHAITGEVMPNMTFTATNIRCNGFQPAICTAINEKDITNSKGEFALSFFQDCNTEIDVSMDKESEDQKHKHFIYKEIADRGKTLSCNGLVSLSGDDSYYFDISLQPQMYLDIYAIDEPDVELNSFYIGDQHIEINKSSYFQTRLKIDISSYSGTIVFRGDYRDVIEEELVYDYEKSDEMEYIVKY